MPLGLVLDPPPARGVTAAPALPSLIRAEGRPVGFSSLDGLARRLHRLRAGRAIQLTPGTAAWGASDTFPILKVWAFDLEGNREYLGVVAIQGRPREALEAALARANPDAPR